MAGRRLATIEGTEKVGRILRGLPDDVRNAVERRLVQRAGTMILGEAIRSAPVRDGNLREAFRGAKARIVRRIGRDGVIGRFGADYRTAPHQHLVEFGTVARGYIDTAGGFHATGIMPPNPFMRNAWARTRPAIQQMFEREVWTEIERATTKRGAR